MKPKVSVCVATYNQERYIKDCLISVIAQEHDVELEILVGDDASTDRSFEIIKEVAESFHGDIKLFRHEENRGPNANYKFLIEKATGDYIAHLDGDDYWMPGKLAAQVEFLRRHEECSAVYTNAVLIGEVKDILGAFNGPVQEVFDFDYLLEKGNFLNHSSMVYRSEYRGNILEMQPPYVDYRIHIKLAEFGKLGFLNQMLVAYRRNAVGSIMANSFEQVAKLLDDTVVGVLTEGKLNRKSSRRIIFDWFVYYWYMIIRLGEIRKGIEKMKRVWSLVPGSPVLLVLTAMPCMFFRIGKEFFRRKCNRVSGSRLYVLYMRR
jgi:glycosyltransferase involved in cell wall biosynthesis